MDARQWRGRRGGRCMNSRREKEVRQCNGARCAHRVSPVTSMLHRPHNNFFGGSPEPRTWTARDRARAAVNKDRTFIVQLSVSLALLLPKDALRARVCEFADRYWCDPLLRDISHRAAATALHQRTRYPLAPSAPTRRAGGLARRWIGKVKRQPALA